MRWLESGTRRDICVLLYGAGTVRVQTLKRQLEERYGDRLDPKPFRDRLEALTRAGHLRREADGIHDGYRLTERGERAVEAQYEWLRERVEGGHDGENESQSGSENANGE